MTSTTPKKRDVEADTVPMSKFRSLVQDYFWSSNPHVTVKELRFQSEMLAPERAIETLNLVADNVPFPLQGRRLLEIGCGVGTYQVVASQAGVLSVGIEPSLVGSTAANYQAAERDGAPGTIACAVGESLPFQTGSFDVVCSFQVLEHVRDPDQVLSESLRILRVGGYLVHVFPNFGSLWEGHYGVIWPPHLPKWLARWYLRPLGRPLDMLEELQLLSHQSVDHLLSRHRNISIVNWGTELWERRVREMSFSEWGHLNRVKLMLRWAHRLRIVGAIIAVGKVLHWETPIVLVVRKDGPTEP